MSNNKITKIEMSKQYSSMLLEEYKNMNDEMMEFFNLIDNITEKYSKEYVTKMFDKMKSYLMSVNDYNRWHYLSTEKPVSDGYYDIRLSENSLDTLAKYSNGEFKYNGYNNVLNPILWADHKWM